MEKEPIGAKPYFIVAEHRIAELSSKIMDYSSSNNIDLIKTWAKEIILQCELVEKMKSNS